MKTGIFLTLLGFIGLISKTKSQCDLTGKKEDREFPDIMKYVPDNYIMEVKYSIPAMELSDYYTEYYDDILKFGRVDSDINGVNKTYIYRSDTWEAWTIENGKCDLQNITLPADFLKDGQVEWLHYREGKQPTTIGPSAMFKRARDAWKKQGEDRRMAYMGTKEGIRGEKAVYWRRCIYENGYGDYYFAERENPFDKDSSKKILTPIRVAFYGVSEIEELAQEVYDIINFHYYILGGMSPFDLPKGRNCRRAELVEGPDLPAVFTGSFLLSAEVVYQRFSTEENKYELLSTYTNTLMFAWDQEIHFMAYNYSSWKKDKDEVAEPFDDTPHYFIYDIPHISVYKINYETSRCEISQAKTFIPRYQFPENGGSLALTDNFVLLANREFSYLSTGTDRGRAVNIFELEIRDYFLDKDTMVPRIIATHSYLKDSEHLENTGEVRNAPTEIELRFFRKENIEEVLTFNILKFSTRLTNKHYLCDITFCFKDDDDASSSTTGLEEENEFPDILQNVADSYIMGVEYTIPGARQTDYYTEFYQNSKKRGRVDSHISGENKKYIYDSNTWEAWTLENRKCDLKNITDTADFFKDDQTDWLHYTTGENPTTVGPSAMFKVAYDVWKKQGQNRRITFIGTKKGIRGEKAVYWRRCIDDKNYVDYFFADKTQENPFDTDAYKNIITPLRVAFYGVSEAEEKELSRQFYDIISFQHSIPVGIQPFDLPKGRNCRRGELVDGLVLPDFSSRSLLLSAEVVYKRYSTDKNRYELLSSYYNTLTFALDRETNHLAYYYSSWKKDKDEDGKPIPDAPHYVIYDMSYAYAYRINFETSKCEISREKSFVPQYQLPEEGGSLGLTDPYVLFPNNELTYLSSGTDRGLAVNIFEAEIKDYVLDKDTVIPRVIASHSYLKSNEKLENTVEVKNAPTQIELRFFRKENIEEVLTFNIFGFTTKLPDKQNLFDVTRCFKNDDDYSFLTIGFEVESPYLTQIENKLPQIEANVLNEVTRKSDLDAARIPTTMTDMKSNIVYVTMLILEKPSLQLDFPDKEEDKTISVASVEDTLGMASFETCADSCLEERDDCWGFSWCGATCYFGSTTNTKIEDKTECTLYRRYKNDTFMPSKDLQISNIVNQVETDEFKIMVTLDNGKRMELRAIVSEVTDPAEDDSLFEKMGNKLNPRMKVFKAASKLKKGSEIKNLGKLRYDECQRLCLDFKNCETMSYCLIDGQCLLNSKYSSDLRTEDMEVDDLCTVLTRKYTDHFDRTPGVFVKTSEGTDKDLAKVEDCARACLKEEKFKCLSFDHCAGQKRKGCTLYTNHFLSLKSREAVHDKYPSCGHYTRKFSEDFRKKEETRIVGSKVPPILNLTLEECAKSCIDYGEGACYGYDFCQDKTLFATSCTLFDSDPSRLQSSYSSICTNYVRTQAEYAPRPYTTSYAGGIGFLCFLIGGFLGAVIVFVIRYIRGNKQEFSDTVLTSNRISSKERRNSMPKDSLSAL